MLEYVPWVGHDLQHFIRGGSEVGSKTLSNFFALHTAVLPALLILLLPFHFWRIRRAGGLVVPGPPQAPKESKGPMLPAIPHLLLREVVVALIAIAFILGISVLFDAPLAEKANPGLSPNPTKAPWYFAGFQELLLHFHPLFSLFIIPLGVILALMAIPYIQYSENTGGIWFTSAIGRRSAMVAVVCAVALTPTAVALSSFIGVGDRITDLPSWIITGLIPTLLLLCIMGGFRLLIRRWFGANRKEVVQSIFVLLLTAFSLLTIIGIWFRGPGMILVWPWSIG
jgi:quinol-cytochrome oxidoreductase complex cytochrome b subunit